MQRTVVLKTLMPILITALVSLGILGFYLKGPANQKFGNIVLTSKMFGVPARLQARGVQPFHILKNHCGWDGQFYYFIANDIFAREDTADHIDANAYRYQRIGLPLMAKIVSKLLFQNWVSPQVYYFTSLAAIILAVSFCAFFFQSKGASPFLILLWSLAAGTQITLLNGLPDGFADALLILAVLALLKRQNILYVATVTFAALSREIYVLVPCFVGFGLLLKTWRHRQAKGLYLNVHDFLVYAASTWFHAIPVLIVVCWQLFLHRRFGVFASSQAGDVLGLPFVSLFRHMSSIVTGHPWLVSNGKNAYYEGWGVLMFACLVTTSLVVLGRFLRKTWPSFEKTPESCSAFSLALGFFFIATTYFFFGDTVMMHYTGYFKAVNVFLFVIPFFLAVEGKNPPLFLWIGMAFIVAYFSTGLWERINGGPYFGPYLIPETPLIYAQKPPDCLRSYKASLELLGIDDFSKRWSRTFVVHVRLTNKTGATIKPFEGKGGVALGARWKEKDGTIVMEGPQTLIAELKDGKSVEASIVVPKPKKTKTYTLILAPVQNGCAWFNDKDPASGLTLSYAIK